MKNWKAILAAVLLLVVIGVAFALLASPNDEPNGTISAIRNVFASDEKTGSDDSEDGTAVGSDSTAPLTGTDGTGSTVAKPKRPKVKDVPAPPAAGPSAAELWQKYLTDTRAVVNNDKPDLTAMIAAVTQALSNGDKAALTGMLAPDEGSQVAYLAALADKYPTILTSAPAGNVNIFTSGGATLYFGYSVVQWTDAGIQSEHTIPIMMRFVDGTWYITTLGDTGGDLQFVQTVTL